MAAVFRNFRRFAVFFTSAKKPKNVKSICKGFTPLQLSLRNFSLNTKSVRLNENMILKSLESSQKVPEKRLTVILAWMNAKEEHLTRYYDFYFENGFDVLTVRTNPFQLLIPPTGSQKVAKSLLDYLLKNEQYQKLVVHAFSVGGYQFGEILVKAQESQYASIPKRVVAQVYDSLIDFYGIPTGFPTAITKNQVLRKLFEMYLRMHLVAFHPIATKHYLKSSETFHNNYIRAPAVFFTSKRDPVAPVFSSKEVADNWKRHGTDVSFVTYDNSKHVQHMGSYPEDYITELKKVLKKANL